MARYEGFGFELATAVLELEIAFDEALCETPAPDGIAIRTYTDADAHRVRDCSTLHTSRGTRRTRRFRTRSGSRS